VEEQRIGRYKRLYVARVGKGATGLKYGARNAQDIQTTQG
jgi:hypothetical protein